MSMISSLPRLVWYCKSCFFHHTAGRTTCSLLQATSEPCTCGKSLCAFQHFFFSLEFLNEQCHSIVLSIWLLQFHDDMNLPCGVLRLQHNGGHDYHKGYHWNYFIIFFVFYILVVFYCSLSPLYNPNLIALCLYTSYINIHLTGFL